MTSDSSLMISLIVFTFAAAIGLGVYQWRKARAARQQHKHSSLGDLREGMPGAPGTASTPRAQVGDRREGSA
jgi:uncharacterized protein HemX